MAFNFRKSVTFQLGQVAKAHRARSGSYLASMNLHPGQDSVLKILDEHEALTMGQLASELSVQPPTVAKMVNRLTTQGLVERSVTKDDGRQVRVSLTHEGGELLQHLDVAWKRLEREALTGLEDKDRKKLRKLLKQVEKNLSRSRDQKRSEASEASPASGGKQRQGSSEKPDRGVNDD